MNTLWFDLRFTLRLLAKSPGFAILNALVIALALALALAIYVLVRNQGLEPIPLPDGDRYVALQMVRQNSGIGLKGDRFNAYALRALQERSQSYEHFGGLRFNGSLTMNDGHITEAPWGTEISPELLELTGAQPLMGRLLTAEDAKPGAPAVILVGYDLWQNFFGGRQDIIGHQIRIEGESHTVVGVMPEGFRYPSDHHLWRPLQLLPNSLPDDDSLSVTPIGILKPGISMEAAGKEAASILEDLQHEYPDDYKNLTAKAIPFIYAASTTDFSVINIVMCAAGLSMLLLASLNVGNLLLVRATERSDELLIRSALGGTRGRIILQVLLESLVIAVVGGGVGIWLGTLGAEYVQYQTEVVVGSAYLPFWMRFDIGADVVLLALGGTGMIWLLAGGIPAWLITSNVRITTGLSGGSKGGSGRGNSRLAGTLVAAEVVLSFFLLILSGAFVASINLASDIDYGIPTRNAIAGVVNFDEKRHADTTKRVRYLEELTAQLEREPGVITATYASALPGMSWWSADFDIAELDLQQSVELPVVQTLPIARDYFPSLGIQLKEGRYFEAGDTASSVAVAIIDEVLADRFWKGESPLGKQIIINPRKNDNQPLNRALTVVGVVHHIDQGQALGRARDLFNLYQPMEQFTPDFSFVVVQFNQRPQNFEELIKYAGTRVDRDIAINMIRPLDESLSLSIRVLQTMSELFVIVTLITLVLAGTGIYGVVSRSVLVRTREMGIRRALGQTDAQTVRLFLVRSGLMLLIGAVFGGGGAVLAASLLTNEFPNLLDSIVVICAAVSCVMATLVIVASYLPARKIIGLEPMVALQYE